VIKQPVSSALKELDREIALSRYFVAGAMLLVLFSYFGWFALKVSGSISSSSSDWGTLGDFFGGLINPIVAALALYWLTRSVRIQKEELNETREALQASASAQVRQVQLAALSALSNSVTAEINLHRAQIIFLCNQIVDLRRSGIRSMQGAPITVEEAERQIQLINDRVTARLLDHAIYEKQIRDLLAAPESNVN
jgi:hypothetical protein